MANGDRDALVGLLDHYQNMMQGGFARWRLAIDEIRDRTYGVDQLVSDSLYFWVEGWLGFWGALKGDAGGTVVLLLPPAGASDAETTVEVSGVPATGDPVATDLVAPLQGKMIPAANVVVDFPQADRSQLRVQLQDLTSLPDPPAFNDRYSGYVTIEGKRIARIEVVVGPSI